MFFPLLSNFDAFFFSFHQNEAKKRRNLKEIYFNKQTRYKVPARWSKYTKHTQKNIIACTHPEHSKQFSIHA